MKCAGSATTLLALIALTLAACGGGDPAAVDSVAEPAAGVPPAADAGAGERSQRSLPFRDTGDEADVARFVGLRAPKPAAWARVPPQSGMIDTNFIVPGEAGGEAVALNVYYFGPDQGGSVQANIDRWRQQFRSPDGRAVEPLVDEFEVNGMPVTFVELAGEWQLMGQAWYTPNQLFFAAIVDAPRGRVFIRLAGDAATVEANREAFTNMIEGLEPDERGPQTQ